MCMRDQVVEAFETFDEIKYHGNKLCLAVLRVNICAYFISRRVYAAYHVCIYADYRPSAEAASAVTFLSIAASRSLIAR